MNYYDNSDQKVPFCSYDVKIGDYFGFVPGCWGRFMQDGCIAMRLLICEKNKKHYKFIYKYCRI